MESVISFVLIIGLLLLWAVVTGKIKSAKFKGPEGLGGLELEAPGNDPPPPAPDVTHHHYGISLKEHEESFSLRVTGITPQEPYGWLEPHLFPLEN